MSKEIDGMQMHLLPLDETCTPKYLKEARCELRVSMEACKEACSWDKLFMFRY